MTEKQEHLLQLFRELDEICREHGLRYVMAGGSAIGVVRNEGFIPWDDDVDIYMPRDDWKKLVEIAKTELPENRTLQCVDVDRSYTNTFPRYASTDTCAVHKHQLIGKDTAGEIIDVLTLDPIPADDREYERYRTHMMIYSELVNMAVVFGARWEIPVFLYLKYLLSYMILGRDKTLKKLEKIMFSYEEEECPRYAMRWGGCPFLFDKDMFFPSKTMNFEGIKVQAPRRMSDYLIWHYGDEWSYIPPHGERESHDAITVEGISYRQLREEYMPKLKKGRLRRDSVVRKLYALANARRAHRLQQKRDLLRAKSTVLDVNARIREKGIRVRELVEKREFRTLNSILAQYFRVQLSPAFIGREDFANIYSFYHPILLDVDDDVFYAAMLTLIYTERIGKAYRMLQVKEKLEELTPELMKLKADIELFRKGVAHYESGETEEAESSARELLERYPENPGFLKFECRMVMERAQAEGRPEEAQAYLDRALELFPEDGYFLKYQGDLLWMRGRCADALEVFAHARETTANGITRLELDKFLEPYKEQTVETCRALLDNREVSEAHRLMELWARLLPGDPLIRETLYLTRVSAAKTRRELEGLLEEMLRRLEAAGASPDVEHPEENVEIYRKALTRAWERLGYPAELAGLRTDILYTRAPEELEWIVEKARDFQIYRSGLAAAFVVMGDARRKQGQTAAAFDCYRQAAEHAGRSYIKTELARILYTDLYEGSRKASAYARVGDASDYLDQWLGRYGSIEELKRLIEELR